MDRRVSITQIRNLGACKNSFGHNKNGKPAAGEYSFLFSALRRITRVRTHWYSQHKLSSSPIRDQGARERELDECFTAAGTGTGDSLFILCHKCMYGLGTELSQYVERCEYFHDTSG